MYIPEFFVGIVFTVIAEIIIIFAASAYLNNKNKRK